MSVLPSVCPSIIRMHICLSISFLFLDDNFSPNLVCALVLWRSGLGLLMGKFSKILTELSARDTPVFSFLPDDNE